MKGLLKYRQSMRFVKTARLRCLTFIITPAILNLKACYITAGNKNLSVLMPRSFLAQGITFTSLLS